MSTPATLCLSCAVKPRSMLSHAVGRTSRLSLTSAFRRIHSASVCRGHGSHVSDNDPEMLEAEKQKNLKGEPGWDLVPCNSMRCLTLTQRRTHCLTYGVEGSSTNKRVQMFILTIGGAQASRRAPIRKCRGGMRSWPLTAKPRFASTGLSSATCLSLCACAFTEYVDSSA